mmetsp:Transcript_41529/g.117507  ORF Transcript_41529/g.117507 Transcript_41529/m.117507 type:complete len:330 (-) Transcript_41529:121-1110(-)
MCRRPRRKSAFGYLGVSESAAFASSKACRSQPILERTLLLLQRSCAENSTSHRPSSACTAASYAVSAAAQSWRLNAAFPSSFLSSVISILSSSCSVMRCWPPSCFAMRMATFRASRASFRRPRRTRHRARQWCESGHSYFSLRSRSISASALFVHCRRVSSVCPEVPGTGKSSARTRVKPRRSPKGDRSSVALSIACISWTPLTMEPAGPSEQACLASARTCSIWCRMLAWCGIRCAICMKGCHSGAARCSGGRRCIRCWQNWRPSLRRLARRRLRAQRSHDLTFVGSALAAWKASWKPPSQSLSIRLAAARLERRPALLEGSALIASE